MIRDQFETLRVWQKGLEFVERVCDLTKRFLKDEGFELTSQLRRAAVSVP